MSYIYGAPSKARNANVVYIYIYIYGHTFGNAETVSFYLLHNVSTLNVGPYIYDVSISGFTRSSIYIHDISSLRVKTIRYCIGTSVILRGVTSLELL